MFLAALVFLASAPVADRQTPFEPRRDAEAVESCMGTLAVLQATADHQDDKVEQSKGLSEASRLRAKLEPYINETISLVGKNEFYGKAAIIHRDVALRLDRIGFMPFMKTAIEHDMLVEAGHCERAIDDWNALAPTQGAKR